MPLLCCIPWKPKHVKPLPDLWPKKGKMACLNIVIFVFEVIYPMRTSWPRRNGGLCYRASLRTNQNSVECEADREKNHTAYWSCCGGMRQNPSKPQFIRGITLILFAPIRRPERIEDKETRRRRRRRWSVCFWKVRASDVKWMRLSGEHFLTIKILSCSILQCLIKKFFKLPTFTCLFFSYLFP